MIASFLTWLGDTALLLAFTGAALLSLMIATWWGELAGIRPHRDKSGLGGFAAIYLFCGLRWLLLAPLVVVGAQAHLPGAPAWWLLAHALLGIVGLRLFGLGIAWVQRDRFVPHLITFPGAVLVPAPALWLGLDVVTAPHANTANVGLLALLILQGVGYWRRSRERWRPEPPAPPSAIVDTDRGGR